MQDEASGKDNLLQLRRNHYNEKLADFVTNSEEMNRIIEYEGELVQKIDPVFKDPEYPFIKAHFYAPRKQLFGKYYPTFWVNMLVIWAMILLLYAALSRRWLRRLGDFIERRHYVQIKKSR